MFCTFFMHVLNINTFLLTINVIILKDFLVNKLLNIHESGVSARALSGRFPYMTIYLMFASTKVWDSLSGSKITQNVSMDFNDIFRKC